MRRSRLVLGGLLVALVVAGLTFRSMWPVTKDVATGQTPGHPNLQPQSFAAMRAWSHDPAGRNEDVLPPLVGRRFLHSSFLIPHSAFIVFLRPDFHLVAFPFLPYTPAIL